MVILRKEKANEIIEDNIYLIYHLPRRYKAIDYYLSGSLRHTLLSIFNFCKKHETIIYKNRYCYFFDTKTLTLKVRKRITSYGVSNRHINLLSALGFFDKLIQNNKQLTKINQNFLEKTNRQRGISFFAIVDLKKRLDEIEERAKIFRLNKVTSGNISYAKLATFDHKLADKIYYSNNRKVPGIKAEEYQELKALLLFLVETNGYCTKEEIYNNLIYPDTEINKLLKIFKKDISDNFIYAPPTKADKEKYNLKSSKWIYKKGVIQCN